MANSSVPKHDFVPAWLKISGEAQTPAVSSENRERRSRRDNRTTAKGPPIGRSRQSSCDQQYSHRDGQDSSTTSYRHHSIDIDESQYYTCRLGDYRIASCRPFGSQPSLNRRTVSRQENNSFINCSGTYKGYSLYDFSSEGSPASNNSGNQSRHASFDRSSNNAQPNKKDNKDVKKESKTDRFNQEFPSLKGDCGDVSSTSPVSVNGGVWDNIRNARFITCSAKKLSGSEKIDPEKRSGSPGSLSISSAVSPIGKVGKPSSPSVVQISKSTLQSQPLMYPPLTTLVRKSSKESYKNSSPIVTKFSFLSQNSRQSSPTPPPLEILNTRLVTHPKNVGNKNDFLKTLRSESEKPFCEIRESKKQEVEDIHGENGTHCLQSHKNEPEDEIKPSERNGGSQLQMDNTLNQRTDTYETNGVDFKRAVDESREKPLLSSSLEAEQRLLKEMGWKEDDSGDEDVYAPLTEDEMREFQNLSKKVNQQRNGLVRNMQLSSPKRLLAPPFTSAPLIPLDDDSCSTSFSDSD